MGEAGPAHHLHFTVTREHILSSQITSSDAGSMSPVEPGVNTEGKEGTLSTSEAQIRHHGPRSPLLSSEMSKLSRRESLSPVCQTSRTGLWAQ